MSRAPSSPRRGASGRTGGTDTRAHVVAVADELIRRKGYARASFEEIVGASGVRRGNIYWYFKTKDEILDAVLERRLDEARATIVRWREESAEPLARLERLVEMVLGRADELAERGCPIGTLSSELGKAGGERRSGARQLFEVYRAFAERELRALDRSPAAAREIAFELLARCQGAAVLAHAYGDAALLARQTVAIRAWLRALVAEASASASARSCGAPGRSPRGRRQRDSR